jgi:hypothetical protein
MFMNMITDNYAQSITDFDKYVENRRRQDTIPLGNSTVSAKPATATKPASDSTADSQNTKSNGLFQCLAHPHPRPRNHRHRHRHRRIRRIT